VSFAKFLFLPSWFAKLLEANFSCFAKIDGCQVGLPNCWSYSYIYIYIYNLMCVPQIKKKTNGAKLSGLN
jgi:hypothetical protein